MIKFELIGFTATGKASYGLKATYDEAAARGVELKKEKKIEHFIIKRMKVD